MGGDASEVAVGADLRWRAEELVRYKAGLGRVDGEGEVVDEGAPAEDVIGVGAGRAGLPAAREGFEMVDVVGDGVAVGREPGEDAEMSQVFAFDVGRLVGLVRRREAGACGEPTVDRSVLRRERGHGGIHGRWRGTEADEHAWADGA